MASYRVTVTRVLENVLEIDADNGFEAIDIAKDIYKTEEPTMSPDDWTSMSFSVDGPH